MRLLKKRAVGIMLACTAFMLLLAVSFGVPGVLSVSGDARANAASQGMGTQPCVLSFENAGVFLNAAPAGAAADAGLVAIAAASALLIIACSRRAFESKSSVPTHFSLVALRVRMDE